MYQRYRQEMRPILQRYGGSFGYDFVVSHVLASETERPINRVFTLCFADRERASAFFADPSYRAVRQAWFEPSWPPSRRSPHSTNRWRTIRRSQAPAGDDHEVSHSQAHRRRGMGVRKRAM